MTEQVVFTNPNAIIECEGECGNDASVRFPYCADCTDEMSQSQRNIQRYFAHTRRNLAYS